LCASLSFKNDRDVLDQLQPHAGLIELTIENYGGTMFSNWLGHATFNIVSVQIHNCKYCLSLPPFGKLPSLKYLSIVGLDVVTIGTDFYGTTASGNKPFGSLETLRFKNMSQLQEWLPFTDDNGDAVALFWKEVPIESFAMICFYFISMQFCASLHSTVHSRSLLSGY
jgi:hypothetical protein